MKLIVDKVEYKYIPVGPAYGTKGFHISFKEVEGEHTLEDIKDENGKVLEATENEKIANSLIEDIQKKISEQKLEKLFAVALINDFICFSGDEIIKDAKNTEILDNILKILEGTSYEFQRELILRRDPNFDLSKANFLKLKSIFICEPKYFTGNRKAYQLFQTVLCKLPLAEDSTYKDTALVEIEGYKNVFHILELTDNYEKELEKLKTEYLDKDLISISPLKTFVNVKTDKKEVFDKLFEYDYIVTREIPNSIDI